MAPSASPALSTTRWPATGAGGFTVGPFRTGRGTCLAGAYWVARTAGGAVLRQRPGLCASGRRREARPPADGSDSLPTAEALPIKQTSRNPPYGGYQLD